MESCSSCHGTADLCGGQRLASVVELRAAGFVSICSLFLPLVSPMMLATYKMPHSEEKVLCGLIMVGPVPQWVAWGWLASSSPGSSAAFLGHFVCFLQVEGPVVLSCWTPMSACNTCKFAEVLLLCFPLHLYVCGEAAQPPPSGSSLPWLTASIGVMSACTGPAVGSSPLH